MWDSLRPLLRLGVTTQRLPLPSFAPFSSLLQILIPNKLQAHQSPSQESASQGTQSVTMSFIY